MGKNSNQRQDDIMTVRLRRLEHAVRDLKINFNETNIHGFVNCVLKGWIVEGRFTDEYRLLIEQAQAEEHRLREEQIDIERQDQERLATAEAAAGATPAQDQLVIDTSRWSIR